MSTKEWRKANTEKARASRRRWYARNRQHAIKLTLKRKQEIREWFHKLKATLSCKCGENYPIALDFHHINPASKRLEVSKMAANGWAKEQILEEIKKCEVLCANCHRKLKALRP